MSGLVFSAQGVKRSGIGGLQKIFARINAHTHTPSSSLLLILGSNLNIMALIWGNHTAQQISPPRQKSQQLLQDSSGKHYHEFMAIRVIERVIAAGAQLPALYIQSPE